MPQLAYYHTELSVDAARFDDWVTVRLSCLFEPYRKTFWPRSLVNLSSKLRNLLREPFTMAKSVIYVIYYLWRSILESQTWTKETDRRSEMCNVVFY